MREGVRVDKNQPEEFVNQLSPPVSTEAASEFCYTNFPQPFSLTPEETLLCDASWRTAPWPWRFSLVLGKTKALPFLLLEDERISVLCGLLMKL